MSRALFYFGLILTTNFVSAADWPQWTGPNRDNDWTETGIIEKFPERGLKFLWRMPVSGGFAGPAVAGGRVYVTDYLCSSGDDKPAPTKRNDLQGKERVLCLDAVTGRVIWLKNLPQTDDAPLPLWGYAGHPLVYNELLICMAGGRDIELLAPQAGERILDVGCGTGQLTVQIVKSGATVVGLRNWVLMFGQHWLKQIPTENHSAFFEQVEEIARPNLFRDSVWYADYRRIRIVARKS